MGKEKRRSPRFTLHQLVNIEYGREDYVYGDAVDISETGIGILCDSALPPSSRLFVMFQLDMSALPGGDSAASHKATNGNGSTNGGASRGAGSNADRTAGAPENADQSGQMPSPGPTIRCEGIVSRSDREPGGRYHVGVDFSDLLDSDRRAIEKFLAAFEPSS